MPPQTEKAMLMLGRFYEGLCKIPLMGEPLARSFSRSMGRLIFYAPGSGAKRQDSIRGVKEYLEETGKQMNFPFEVIPESVGPDSFEFFIRYCPYGFKRPDQEKACDAAMEMDRILFNLIGADLIIQESAVQGAPKCRIMMKRRG